MPLPKSARAIHLTAEEWRKLDWLEGSQGSTAHARAVKLLREYLKGKPDPPAIQHAARYDDD